MRKVSVLFPVAAFNRKSCSIHIFDDKLDLTEKYSICNRYPRDRRFFDDFERNQQNSTRNVKRAKGSIKETIDRRSLLYQNYEEEKDENLISVCTDSENI